MASIPWPADLNLSEGVNPGVAGCTVHQTQETCRLQTNTGHPKPPLTHALKGGVPCAVRKVGHSPPPVCSFLGVGLPQGTIAIVYPCSINPPPSCVYVPLQTGTLRPVYGDTFSGCLPRGIIFCSHFSDPLLHSPWTLMLEIGCSTLAHGPQGVTPPPPPPAPRDPPAPCAPLAPRDPPALRDPPPFLTRSALYWQRIPFASAAAEKTKRQEAARIAEGRVFITTFAAPTGHGPRPAPEAPHRERGGGTAADPKQRWRQEDDKEVRRGPRRGVGVGDVDADAGTSG